MWSRLPNLVTGLALGLAAWSVGVDAVTCGELKTFYKNEQCCGQPTQEVSAPVPGTAACPYSFAKPACSTAEPQTPRDLTAGAVGSMTPKAATLTDDQANFLPLVNVHFHLGAEHKTEAYSDDTDSIAYDAASSGRRLAGNVRPGFMCSKSSLNANQLAAYNFTYCKGDVQVGKSYEIHYVHSSAGMDNNATDDMNADLLADGLGGAANGRGLLNPMIVVQGQIFQIVNGAATVDDMLHGWTVVGHDNSVMYPGSTTGQSHDNEVCSPYSITWHVDKDCHQVSPESFDNLCKQMSEAYGMYADLYPHGSRKLGWVIQLCKTPRDLTAGAVGSMTPKAATLTDDQANFLPLVNVHFHLGAEHKTEAYSDDTDSIAYDAASSGRRLAGNVRPGFMCSKSSLNANQLAAYNFTYCKGDVQVGKSYEIHYVHSSAGMDNNATDEKNADLLADGLGGAANGRGLLNPMIVVQGQIFQIVNGAATVDDMLHGWTVVGHDNSVMYPGSTTGQSHDNEVCSPYSITWHVDKDCHQVSPESFDNLCKQMSEAYGMYADLYPHGSRKLVSSQYVVKSEFVKPLA
ncbi:unnamed protein product [Symbiodinium sp. CCMP2592]|nr:unnamed protein product [Symbiodinium sp. CCMP2592]